MAESTRVLNIPPEEIEAGKTMAFISYLSVIVGLPLFIIPLVVEDMKKNKFTMYHTEQAIVLYIVSLIGWVAGTIGSIVCVGAVLYLLVLLAWIFGIIGIINSFGGKVTPIPLFGQFGEKFNLVK
jgi:uncharacterized membrane protein